MESITYVCIVKCIPNHIFFIFHFFWLCELKHDLQYSRPSSHILVRSSPPPLFHFIPSCGAASFSSQLLLYVQTRLMLLN